MFTRIRNHKKAMITMLIIVIILIIGGIVAMSFRHYVGIRGQHLREYSFCSGGGMTGGYYKEHVAQTGSGQALVSIEKTQWHNQDPTVEEYLVDAEILEDLEAIVRKHHMNFWDGKKFTKMFVADGESKGYSFAFDDAYIYFSSQIYPSKYANKLRELSVIVKEYTEKAEKLPGLVNGFEENDAAGDSRDLEGEIAIYVSSYIGGTLEVKIWDGTDQDIEVSRCCRIENADSKELIFENESSDTITVYSGWHGVADFKPDGRLEAGNYRLILDGYETTFEIR